MRLVFSLVITTFTLATCMLYAQFGQDPPNGGRGSRRTTRQEQPPSGHTEVVSGVVRKVDADSFELEAEDTRFLIIQLSADSKGVRVGDGLDVTANVDADGMFHVVSIRSNKEIAQTINEADNIGPDDTTQEARTGPPPTILVRPDATDPDDSGPPKLKRGQPAARASTPIPSDDNPPVSRASLARNNPPVAHGNPHMALIEQAREEAATFLQNLPNYVCQEQTTRYVSETRTPSWNVVDVVSAEVVYDDHQESYRNLQINGRPTKKAPEDSGAWSTGEFGTILGNLFAPQSATEFKYVQEDTVSHRATSLFDFKVQRVRANWKIWVPGQYVVPEYKGSVWIDNKTAQVLRIEMQAKQIPAAFPEISVETAVDYDTISLGAADKFLLPVHAEALSCWRNSNECQRNTIEFRNYHKFEGESVIKFEQEQEKK
jgi:hypothetical protein